MFLSLTNRSPSCVNKAPEGLFYKNFIQVVASLTIVILTTSGVINGPRVTNYATRVVNNGPRIFTYAPRVINYAPRIVTYARRVIN